MNLTALKRSPIGTELVSICIAGSKYLSAASIDVTTMTNLDDQHGKSGVLDLVNDSISTLPDTIALLARKLLATCRPRIICKRPDALHDPLDFLLRESSQVFSYGFLEEQLIACHAPSDP